MEGEFEQFIKEPKQTPKSGCYTRMLNEETEEDQYFYLPLRHLDYSLEIVNGLMMVTLNQAYHNTSGKYLEVGYSIPIDSESCIYKFEVSYEGILIEGVIKQRKQAQKQYQNAISQGRKAAKGSFDEKSREILHFNIGNIPPKTQFHLTISFIQELQITVNMFYKICIPSSISPQYMNKTTVKKDLKRSKKTKIFQKANYTWSFKIGLSTTHKINFWKSSTHTLSLMSQNKEKTELILTMQKSDIPNKDFVFFYSIQNYQLPSYILSNDANTLTAMVSIIPKFCSLALDDAYKAAIGDENYETRLDSAKGNFIFLLDCSGSMNGQSIDKAKQSLILFLKSLPEDSYFNIITFGTKSKKMFEKSERYSSQKIIYAIDKVKQMKADMGGTQIYQPLFQILNYPPIESYPSHVFILTDGQVSDTQSILQMVEKYTKFCRVHTIGIGSDVCKNLVKGCAQKGKGKYVLISGQNDPSQKIIDLLSSVQSPVIDKIELIYDQKLIESITPNPKSIPYILKGDILNFFITFKQQIKQKVELTFRYLDPIDKKAYESNIEIKQQQSQLRMPFIGKMSHFKVLRNLEISAQKQIPINDQMIFSKVENIDRCIIDYSVKHQILSKQTSFICVGKKLVDGQFQEFESRGVEQVQVNQFKEQQCKEQKKSKHVPYYMRNCGGKGKVSCKVIISKKTKKQEKKLLKLERQRNNQYKNQDLSQINSSSQQSSSQSQSESEKESEQSKKQNKNQDPMTRKIVDGQTIFGYWNNQNFIQELTNNPNECMALAEKIDKTILITKIIILWFQKYEQRKQYKLILKKATEWLEKQKIDSQIEELLKIIEII